MTGYRRSKVAGGSYFFTLALAERRSTLLVDRIELLREAIRTVRARHPFEIDAMVVLPDHLHCIWTLPENDSDYATRWNLIKGNFSRAIEPGERRRESRVVRRERGVWQRRFWEHAIRDECDYNNHVAYIHINPVKHGHVARCRLAALQHPSPYREETLRPDMGSRALHSRLATRMMRFAALSTSYGSLRSINPRT